VKALQAAGVWKPEHDAHNAALIKRQDLLAATWADFIKTNPAESTFRKDWMTARAAALTKAGLDVIFE
jgi:ribosomal protein S19E (S16A)